MNALAFSTLGCPVWDLPRILSAAREYGYNAVELRGYLDQMDLPLADPFTPANRTETRRRFEDAGVAVCCVSSSGTVAKNNLDHVKAHAELAGALGCPRVRVFGGKLPDDLPHAEGIARFAETLRAFGDAAQEAGVYIVLETHDSFSKGAEVAELLAATAHPAVFSLWDLHHPYREGESLEETNRYLAPTLRHVHVKDGAAGNYTLLGEGDVPVFPMLDLVLGGGYDGPISLEWEKRWKPDIAEPEVAFPQYAKALRAYLDGRGAG
jgi:sugar phosphate isomerase/epimerase